MYRKMHTKVRIPVLKRMWKYKLPAKIIFSFG
uniref:Uncharacterized protein n=1 Tax=Arundo donax TaxID=35708 RepID=A0A0A9A1S2_ARUDO